MGFLMLCILELNCPKQRKPLKPSLPLKYYALIPSNDNCYFLAHRDTSRCRFSWYPICHRSFRFSFRIVAHYHYRRFSMYSYALSCRDCTAHKKKPPTSRIR